MTEEVATRSESSFLFTTADRVLATITLAEQGDQHTVVNNGLFTYPMIALLEVLHKFFCRYHIDKVQNKCIFL